MKTFGNNIMKHLKPYSNFLNEGLTRSVDADTVRKNLIRKEGINPDSITLNGDKADRINICFTSKNADKLRKVHDKMTKAFGWFLSAVGTDDLGDPYWEQEMVDEIDIDETVRLLKWYVEEYDDEFPAYMIYERKFEKEYDLKPTTLYHVTSLDSINKIKRQGLVPKSRNKKSIHPDRIYLVVKKEDFNNTDLLDYINKPVILEIDNSKLNLKLHHDINFDGAVYTTDNIPPQSIKFPN